MLLQFSFKSYQSQLHKKQQNSWTFVVFMLLQSEAKTHGALYPAESRVVLPPTDTVSTHNLLVASAT